MKKMSVLGLMAALVFPALLAFSPSGHAAGNETRKAVHKFSKDKGVKLYGDKNQHRCPCYERRHFTFTFPVPGHYRLWIQAERHYTILTVPVEVDVAAAGAS